MKQDLIAFWKHDRFPYYLSGDVEFFTDNNRVAIKQYQACLFKPALIVPKLKGQALRKKLDEYEIKYNNLLDSLYKEWGKKIDNLMEI